MFDCDTKMKCVVAGMVFHGTMEHDGHAYNATIFAKWMKIEDWCGMRRTKSFERHSSVMTASSVHWVCVQCFQCSYVIQQMWLLHIFLVIYEYECVWLWLHHLCLKKLCTRSEHSWFRSTTNISLKSDETMHLQQKQLFVIELHNFRKNAHKIFVRIIFDFSEIYIYTYSIVMWNVALSAVCGFSIVSPI